MRRALVPALTVALLPFVAVSPADAAPGTPVVITPGSRSAPLTFDVPDPAPSATAAAVVIHEGAGNEIRREGLDLPLVPGPLTWTWDGRAEGVVVPDGSYTAHLQVDGLTIDAAQVYVNLVAPKAVAAPTSTATSLFPFVDGYRDTVAFTGADVASEIPVTASLQVLNSTGTVVWSSPSTYAKWNGRTNAGAVVPAGTYRVRSRFVDAYGLVGYSPTRNVTVSAARLVTRKVVEKVEPRRYATGTYTGKCGKVFRPARKGKTWKKSVGLASRHKCGGGKYDGAVEVTFGAWWPTLHDVSSLRLEVVGGGHTRAKRNVAVGYSVKKNRELGKVRRLPARYGTRTMLAVTGARARSYVNDRGEFYWGVIAYEGSRYDVKSFRLKVVYRTLVDPSARVAGAAGGVQPLN